MGYHGPASFTTELINVRGSDNKTGVSSFVVRTRGQAVCAAGEECQFRTGTYLGKPRTDARFDYSSALVHKKVLAETPVFCGDSACQKIREQRDNGRRQLRDARRKARKQPADG
jgi:hypothetical protein